MDQQDWTTPSGSGGPNGSGEHVLGNATPANADSGARLVPISDDWAAGVGAVQIAPRSRKLRWGVAIGIVLCVTIVTTLGAFVLSGAGGTKSLTAGYAPKDSLFFMNVRTDLPGDQHAKLADFLSHFPGFKDRAQFDNGYDVLLNRLTSLIAADLRYTSAFKPWMAGEISIAVTDIGLADPGFVDAVVIVSVKDRTKAEDWINSQIGSSGMKFAEQDYAGARLFTTGSGPMATAYAITDKALLLGTPGGVKASLDAKTKGSLEGEANYNTAMKSFSGDHVASFYMATGLLMSETYGSLADLGGLSQDDINYTLKSMPAWVAGSVRFESDRVVVEMASPRPAVAATVGNHSSKLAARLPASTVGLMEVHSVGQMLTRTLNQYDSANAPPTYRATAKAIRDALQEIGGLDWLDDTSVVVTESGGAFSGGIVAEVPDSSTASAKLVMLTNLIALSSGTTGIVTHDETYKGVTITVAHMAGGASTIPTLDFALASKDNLIIGGYDVAFVKAVIDTTPETSLAAQSDYKAVMAAAGESNAAAFYVDLSALANRLGPTIFPANPTAYDLDYKPYLDHLGGAALTYIDGQAIIMRLVLMAK